MIEVLVGIGVPLVAILGISQWQRTRRRSDIAVIAKQLGWSYAPRDDSYGERWTGPPFGRGGARAAENVMTGRYRERDVVVFDYEYQSETSDSADRQREFTVYAIALPVRLPTVQISPATFLARVARAVGRNDIRLPCESFNDSYRVKTQDPQLAYAMLTPANTDLLLTQDSLQLRTEGATLLGIDTDRLAADRIPARLDLMSRFLDNVPDFVWKDRQRGTAER